MSALPRRPVDVMSTALVSLPPCRLARHATDLCRRKSPGLPGMETGGLDDDVNVHAPSSLRDQTASSPPTCSWRLRATALKSQAWCRMSIAGRMISLLTRRPNNGRVVTRHLITFAKTHVIQRVKSLEGSKCGRARARHRLGIGDRSDSAEGGLWQVIEDSARARSEKKAPMVATASQTRPPCA